MKKCCLLLILLMVSAGCSVHHPRPAELPAPLPDAFSGGPAEGGPAVDRWWEVFDDSRLNALMEKAFSGNLDLGKAFARVEQARALYRGSAALKRPALSLQGEAALEETPGVSGSSSGDSYSLSLAAGFELDLWKRLEARATAAGLEAAASREDVQTLYLTLSARLADLYYLAAEQRVQLRLSARRIDTFREILSLVRRRYVEGLVPAHEVYRARQNLAVARAGLSEFEERLGMTEHAISVLLGDYPGGTPAGDLIELPGIPEAFPAGLPSELLARRPDVEAALLRLRASDARVAAAAADRFPSVNLAGSYGTVSTVFSTGDIVGSFWKVLLDLAHPLLDGGRGRAEEDRARALFRERLLSYQQVVLKAFQEVEDALVRNRAGEERISRLLEEAEAARASHRLSLDRYRHGLSGYLEVLDARVRRLDVESRLAAARRRLISDRISLARALGGRWMEREMEDRLNTDYRKGAGQ